MCRTEIASHFLCPINGCIVELFTDIAQRNENSKVQVLIDSRLLRNVVEV